MRIRTTKSGLDTAISLVWGLRAAILVGCASGATLGWVYESPITIGLCAVIAGEELLETTVVLAALRDGRRKGIAQPWVS